MAKDSISSTIFTDKKTGKQIWRVYWYDIQGKRHNASGRTKTKAEAKRAIATKQSELLQGADFSRQDVTMASYFEEYLSRYKRGNAKRATQLRYDNFIKVINKYWGSKQLKEITPDLWQDFINHYSEDHVKDTVMKLNGYAHGMVKVAQSNGIIQRDFASHVTYPDLKQSGDAARLRWLEIDDLKKLKNYVYSTAHFSAITSFMAALMIDAGLRFEEVAGCRWQDVDFKKHLIHVEQTWDYKQKETEDGEAPTKTPAGVRTIEVPAALTDLLAKLQTQQKRVFEKQGYVDKHDLVFRTVRHTVISDEGANKMLRKYQTAVGIPKEKQVTCHGLRHSHVAFLAAQPGIEIYYISQRIGHKNPAITLKYYYHLLKHVADAQAGLAVDALAKL